MRCGPLGRANNFAQLVEATVSLPYDITITPIDRTLGTKWHYWLGYGSTVLQQQSAGCIELWRAAPIPAGLTGSSTRRA